jgi:hypothetical protein
VTPLYQIVQSEQDMLIISETTQAVQIIPTNATNAFIWMRQQLAKALNMQETIQ